MSELSKSMQPVASFIFENLDDTNAKKLCLFPGHYDTSEIVSGTESGSLLLAYSNPAGVTAAGFPCDQVADDYNVASASVRGDGTYTVKITPKTARTRYRDFLNYIKTSGLRVIKMRFTDLKTDDTHEIFNQELEVSASAIGQKAGSDFIQLSQHVDPSNYNQSFIDVDLTERNLLLDETTLASLMIPASAKFQIDFTLAKI